jgi:hypothetical protein
LGGFRVKIGWIQVGFGGLSQFVGYFVQFLGFRIDKISKIHNNKSKKP